MRFDPAGYLASVPLPLLWGLTGVLGLLTLGALAALALPVLRPNRDHTNLRQRVTSWWVMAALLAGLVQGMLSGLLTLGLKRFLEAGVSRLPDLWAAILPPVLTCAGVLAILLTAHRLAGTPNVWATISVPYAVSSSYAWIYSLMLVLARRRARSATA